MDVGETNEARDVGACPRPRRSAADVHETLFQRLPDKREQGELMRNRRLIRLGDGGPDKRSDCAGGNVGERSSLWNRNVLDRRRQVQIAVRRSQPPEYLRVS